MPSHRPRPQRRSRTRARCSSRRCRRGCGTGRLAPLDRLPNATRRVPTPALASTRSPTADLGRRCAERSPHPLADSASTPRSHLGRSRQTSRFILSLDTLGSSYVIHRSAWRDCLKTLELPNRRAYELPKWGTEGLFLQCCATETHAPETTERLFRQSLE